ncbi:MAG: geopeptide radical SAM maturase [Desulfuromonadaceae bacterium]|nr:geopeptide radical SAM maturase [Desulfuromonadaceae bacterium]
MELSHYVIAYPCPDKPGRLMLLATRRCAVLELSETLWEKVCTGGELSEKERNTFIRLGVLVESRAAERDEMRNTFDSINNSSRRFEVTAVLTLECNLACPYCFEEPFRGHLVMSAATADLLVERLREKMAAGLDLLVDFYGGEALLRLELLKSIAARLRDAAAHHGVSFAFNVFSNGVLLTRRTVEELLPLGLQEVRTTLDGPPDIHNVQRPFVSGMGSFDLILNNLVAVHDIVALDLGGNYTRDNYRRFPKLLDLIIEAGIDPARLKAISFSPVMPKSDGSGVGDHAATCACSSDPWAIEANLFLRAETIRRGFPLDKLQASACMIEFANDLVVGYDGTLYKCPVFMGQEEMRVGSLADGISDYRESHNMDVWKNDTCLECAYLPLCFGGCRFFRKLQTGAIDGVDCRREMLDASLELLVRQVLGKIDGTI